MGVYQILVIDNVLSYNCYVSNENIVEMGSISSDVYTPHLFMINIHEDNAVSPKILPGMQVSVDPDIKDEEDLFAVE